MAVWVWGFRGTKEDRKSMEYLKEHPEEFEIDEKWIEEQTILLDERREIFEKLKNLIYNKKKE